jgi:hypothetical protein
MKIREGLYRSYQSHFSLLLTSLFKQTENVLALSLPNLPHGLRNLVTQLYTYKGRSNLINLASTSKCIIVQNVTFYMMI